MLRLIGTALGICGLAGSPALAQVADVVSERPGGGGPTRVEVAFYLVDLMKVIDRDETFEADVFILASWKDPRLTGERMRIVPVDKVWMPNVVVFNERDVSSKLPHVVEFEPDGTVTYRQRLIGTFSSPLELRRFPFDSQTLEVRLVVYGTTTDEVVLVESERVGAARSAQLAITDWEVGELETEASAFDPVPGIRLSSLAVRVRVHRHLEYYVVQMLIPLILIVAMSWIAFWIDPSIINVRISVCVTTVLTLIAYRFMIGGLVPRLPYLTRVDFLLLGSTALVATSLATVVAGAYLTRRDRASAVTRLDAIARTVLPAGFVLLIALIRLTR